MAESGCEMKICKRCHGRTETFGAVNTSLCLAISDFVEVWGNPEHGVAPEHCWSKEWTLAHVDPRCFVPKSRNTDCRNVFFFDKEFQQTFPVRNANGAMLCGIQWDCHEDSTGELKVSHGLKRVLAAMFEALKGNVIYDRASDSEFRRCWERDGWTTRAHLMFSSKENYCLFVHKRYGGLVEGRFFDASGNARMLLSVRNQRGPKKYGCSMDCDLGAFVKSVSEMSVAPGPPGRSRSPRCCSYCNEKLEETMLVSTGRRGRGAKVVQLVGAFGCSRCGVKYMHERCRLKFEKNNGLARQYMVCSRDCEAEAKQELSTVTFQQNI